MLSTQTLVRARRGARTRFTIRGTDDELSPKSAHQALPKDIHSSRSVSIPFPQAANPNKLTNCLGHFFFLFQKKQGSLPPGPHTRGTFFSATPHLPVFCHSFSQEKPQTTWTPPARRIDQSRSTTPPVVVRVMRGGRGLCAWPGQLGRVIK